MLRRYGEASLYIKGAPREESTLRGLLCGWSCLLISASARAHQASLLVSIVKTLNIGGVFRRAVPNYLYQLQLFRLVQDLYGELAPLVPFSPEVALLQSNEIHSIGEVQGPQYAFVGVESYRHPHRCCLSMANDDAMNHGP